MKKRVKPEMKEDVDDEARDKEIKRIFEVHTVGVTSGKWQSLEL